MKENINDDASIKKVINVILRFIKGGKYYNSSYKYI